MASKPRLKPFASQFTNRVRKNFGSLRAWWGTSSSLQSAGDRVSELKAEIRVEAAMVSANCL